MHTAAYEFVARTTFALGPRKIVCELGSRNVNGSVRPLFIDADVYLGVDSVPGPDVDIVADAGVWRPEDPGLKFDTVVSTEVLEHARNAAAVCQTAYDILSPAGVFIITAAGPGRYPHSAVDGGTVRAGEWYRNVTEGMMREWLKMFGVVMVDTFTNTTDIYGLAVKV